MTDAASVMAVRPSADGLQVVLVRRARGAMAGGWAFPGGKLEAADAEPSPWVRSPGLTVEARAQRLAAVRELFEETGVLVGVAAPRGEGVEAPREGGPETGTALGTLRAALLAGRASFAEVLERAGLVLDLAAVHPIGEVHLRGFVMADLRIAVHLVALPPEAAPAGDGPEGEIAVWPARALLGQWAQGGVLMPPTVRARLAVLAQWDGEPTRDVDELNRDLDGELIRALAATLDDDEDGAGELVPGVRLIPLRTATLPPATHTNAYLLGTGEARVLVDPGATDPGEHDRLTGLVDRLGVRVSEFWLTHAHPDHVGGAAALAARLGATVRAHRETAARLHHSLLAQLPGGRLGRAIEDGEETLLSGPLPHRWRAVHTPGHDPGHLCFHEQTTGALVAGDLVAGVGTVVIDPPEGDMAAYLASLRRVRGLGARVLLPAHGPPTGEPDRLLAGYLFHRRMREAAILRAVEDGRGHLAAIVPLVYTDIPETMYGLAERSVLAHLIHLSAQGRAARQGDTWVATER